MARIIPKRFTTREPSSDARPRDGSRRSRVDAVVAEAARRLDAGETVDVAALQREHADLMPESGDRLRQLGRLIELARRAARNQPACDALDEVLDEELHLLRRTLKNYEVLQRVHYGGQGVVYRARQRGTNRIVALKLLLDGPLASKRQRHRFAREIELVSRLRHPNIVSVYDSGVVRGRSFYAMEFVEGQPIDDYVILNDLSPRDIVQLFIKVCSAVHHAHQNGIIHRDLNPSNILVDEDGEPRVYDFGLAKDLWADGHERPHLLTGPGCGTLPYLSPEQAGSGDGVDVRSDIYAIGVVLYELLTDMFPYPIRGEPAEARKAIINDEPLPLQKAITQGGSDRALGLETINRDLETILGKALAKAKADRYQTAGDFADDLQRWLVGDAVTARAGSRLYIVRKTLRKHRIAVGFAAVIFAAFTISSITITKYWLQAREERDNARAAAQLAYEYFDMALTDVEESVRPLPGGVAVRDRLITRLSDKLSNLEALAKSDETFEPILIRLLEKQGDIALQQGRRDEAAEYYQAFLQNTLRLTESKSAQDTHLNDAIRGYRKLAEASDDPTPLFERGVEFAEEIASRQPANEEARYELCQLHLAFGEYLRNSGSEKLALHQFERTLELCPSAEDETPPDVRWPRIVAEALSGRGLGLRKLGDGTQGKKDIRRSLQLREGFVAQNPADMEVRSALLWSYVHLGTCHRDAGELEEARQYLSQAAEQSEILAAMDPSSIEWDRDRYSVLHRLSSLCLDTHEVEEARTCAKKAMAIAHNWVARDNTDEARTTLMFAHMLQGKLQKSEEEWADAYRSFEEAVSIGDLLLEQDPHNPGRMSLVAAAYDGLASCARELGNLSLAFAHRRCQWELQTRRITLQPDAIDAALKVIAAQVKLASAHVDLQTTEHRATAEQLLTEVENWLVGLRSTGKLAGWEGKYEYLHQAIESNREILRGEEPARTRTQNGTPQTDEAEQSDGAG